MFFVKANKFPAAFGSRLSLTFMSWDKSVQNNYEVRTKAASSKINENILRTVIWLKDTNHNSQVPNLQFGLPVS